MRSNGGPRFKFNEAVSFFISVETQQDVDYFGSQLTADGGKPSQSGWLKDKFGLSGQVVPTALGHYLGDPDRKKADRVMQAMMKMGKIVIADLEKVYAGGSTGWEAKRSVAGIDDEEAANGGGLLETGGKAKP